jgi:hypothetical protein
VNDATFERDLRSALVSLVPDEIPGSLFEGVNRLPADASPRREVDWFGRVAVLATSAVATVVLVSVGAIVVANLEPQGLLDPGTGAGGRVFGWQSGVVRMEADRVAIEVGGRVFQAPANARVRSDPGTPTYRTLEMAWNEAGVEMRLNVYFAADDDEWWVTEIRTYDGHPNGDWIHYQAPEIRAALGESYAGDVELGGTGRREVGTLSIDSLLLDGFAAGTGVSWQEGCNGIALGEGPDGEPHPVSGAPHLSELGVDIGVEAADAHSRLNSANVCHDFRYNYDLGENSGYAQIWCTPPPGIVNELAFGSDGQVILFVDAAPGTQLPPNFFLPVGC